MTITEFHNPLAAISGGEATTDRIRQVKLSTITLPLDTPISDAKVLTGRQKPMTEIVFLFAEISTQDGHEAPGQHRPDRCGRGVDRPFEAHHMRMGELRVCRHGLSPLMQ